MAELKTGDVIPSKAPNLPIAPVEYSQTYMDQVLNALRLYFNQVDNVTGNYASGSNTNSTSSGTASYAGTAITGAYSRPYNDMFGDIRSVFDFAPTSAQTNVSYDWTSAIQAAIDSMGISGGLVYFPSKNAPSAGYDSYHVSGTITVNKNAITIDGFRNYVTLDADTTLFSLGTTGGNYNVTIQNFVIIGDSGVTFTPSSYIIDTTIDVGALRVNNLSCLHFGSGVRLRGNYFYIIDCKIDNICQDGYGIYINQYGSGDGLGWIANTSCSGVPNTYTNGNPVSVPGARPKACVFCDEGGAIQITSCEFFQAQVSLWLQPTATTSGLGGFMCVNTFFDTFDYSGILFDNTVNPSAVFLWNVISNCWISNGGQTNKIYNSGTGIWQEYPTGTGINIPNNCKVEGLLVSNCEFYGNYIGVGIGNNCALEGISLKGNILACGTEFYPGQAEINIGANAEKFLISDNFVGKLSGFYPSTNGVFINTGCVDFSVVDNRMQNMEMYGGSSAQTGYCVIANNSFDTQLFISTYCSNYVVEGNKINGFSDSGSQPKIVSNNLIISGSSTNLGMGYSLPVNRAGSYSLGNTYQNSSTINPMMVCVTATSNANTQTDYLVVLVGSSSSLSYGVGDAVVVAGPGGTVNFNMGVNVSFMVPPSKYYRVYNLAGYLNTVSAWVEYN